MIAIDTHALVWWQAGGERLSARARREIEGADRVLLSPITFWELAMLVHKERIELDRDPFVWVNDLLSDEQVDILPLTATAAIGAGLLPAQGFEGDPADCLIVASAREATVPLVSKDTRIRSFAAATGAPRVVW